MAKISQFVLWARWALLPPSSGTQSEHRSGTAAQSGLCFGVSSGCPVTMRHRAVFMLGWVKHHLSFCHCTRQIHKWPFHSRFEVWFNLHQSPLSHPLGSWEPMAWQSEKSIKSCQKCQIKIRTQMKPSLELWLFFCFRHPRSSRNNREQTVRGHNRRRPNWQKLCRLIGGGAGFPRGKDYFWGLQDVSHLHQHCLWFQG